MKISSLRTPNENLQVLLDRYSLVGDEHGHMSVDMVTADEKSLASTKPRRGRLYGELTKRGLVHVWADIEKTQFARAQVLVIDDKYVWAGTHAYNRRTDERDWRDYTDVYNKIPLASHADNIAIMPYDLVALDESSMAAKYQQEKYNKVVHALAQFAEIKCRYDALHQTVAHKAPHVSVNEAPLYPYAGDAYGPRINVEDMRDACMPLHPAVIEALAEAPDLIIVE